MKRGFIAGAFDLLHPGHIKLLSECKERCDFLIVGLHVDPSIERTEKNRPVQTVFERYLQLKACRYVDQIIPYEFEKDLINMLHILNIDVRFLGSDYEDKQEYTGRNIVPVEFIPRLHSYSSTELRERMKQ